MAQSCFARLQLPNALKEYLLTYFIFNEGSGNHQLHLLCNSCLLLVSNIQDRVKKNQATLHHNNVALIIQSNLRTRLLLFRRFWEYASLILIFDDVFIHGHLSQINYITTCSFLLFRINGTLDQDYSNCVDLRTLIYLFTMLAL